MKKTLLLSFVLFNTLITYAQEIMITGKVVDDLGVVLPGTDVIIKGTTKGATTNFDGEFTIDAPSDGILIFSSLGYGKKEIPINGQTSIDVTLETAAEQLLETIVIGSRGQARSQMDSPVPVDVINIAEQSVNIPQTDLGQMLATTAPSFTAYVNEGGDLSSHVAPPSLRGLAPNQMLVLINGKKRHSSALLLGNQTGTPSNAVDMSLIPAASIASVQILRDGASAQYGSDAIAGVMNIILKKATNKFTGTLTMGGYPNSPPDLSDSDLTDEEKALDRDTGADGFNYQFDGNYGFGFENGGYLNITGMLRQSKRTIRPTVLALERSPLYSSNYLNNELTNTNGNPIITNPELVTALANGDAAAASELTTVAGLMNARGIQQKDVATYAGKPAMNIGSLAYNLALPISDDVDFYSFGDASFKYTEGFSCFYRRAAQADRFSYELYPNGFRPQMYTNQTNLGFSAGVEGMLGDFKFDLSNTFGTNVMDIGMFNTWNASIGNTSPTDINIGLHSYTQNTANLDISRYLDDVLEGFNIAGGIEYRMENYQIEVGQEEGWTAGEVGVYTATEDNEVLIGPDGFPLEDLDGNQIVDGSGNAVVLPYAGVSQELVKGYALNCQCFGGFSPNNASNSYRTVMAAYLDTELDVTDNFFVGAAIRSENYSDFGNVFTWKVASRFSITDNFALRGSYSTGFRAPSLQELNYSQSYTFFVNLVPFDGTLYQNNSSASKAIGIANLTEEKSKNISFGFTAKLWNKLDITVDAYKIDISDRIFQTNDFDASEAPVLEPLIGSGYASFRINGGDISTKGLEVVANYNTYFGENKLGVIFSGTFRENKFEGATVPNLNTALTDEELEAKYVSRASIGQFEKGTPSAKIIGTVTYDFGKFSALLRGTRYGSTESLNNNIQNLQNGLTGYPDQYFTPEFTTDIGLTYKFSPSVSLTVGGNNIFNEYPEIQRYELRTFGLYSDYQQGSSGAYYFGRITFSL